MSGISLLHASCFRSFILLFLITPRGQSSPFHLYMKARSGRNLRHLYGQPSFILFIASTRRLLLISHIYLYRNPAALIIYFLQNARQFSRFLPAKHRILQGKLHPFPLKSHVGPLEKTVLHRRSLFQFQKNTFSVRIHQLLRIVLGGKCKALVELDNDRHVRKKLPPDFPLYSKHILLADQMICSNVNTQKILPLGARHSLHCDIFEQILQSCIQF